jgi:hypothetical protein
MSSFMQKFFKNIRTIKPIRPIVFGAKTHDFHCFFSIKRFNRPNKIVFSMGVKRRERECGILKLPIGVR